jgi:hypothetical protein
LRRHAACQGFGKLIRQFPLHPRGSWVADVRAQGRDINFNIADRPARLGQSVLTRDRREKRRGAAYRKRDPAYQSKIMHGQPP